MWISHLPTSGLQSPDSGLGGWRGETPTDSYALDVPAVLEAAARTRTVVELNVNPQRVDIDWRHISRALEMGITISINPDAHTTEGIADAFLGVGVGRKGWLTADRTLNARPLNEVRRFLAGQRAHKGGRS